MEEDRPKSPIDLLVGDSRPIRDVRQQLANAAPTDATVLLTGESGTGKGVAAKMLHDLGPRQKHRFVGVSCPAIPSQLFELELFGYESGAFTGASGTKLGKFEQANSGTLFLDEIGELEIGIQAKLLQVLQESQVSRLGSIEERKVNVRLICGTNRHLEYEVDHGRFRADLFYRINVIEIAMPPLREMRGDIPILLEHFIRHYSDRFGHVAGSISPSLMHILCTYHWPGNVRELENIAKRFVVFRDEDHILPSLRKNSDNGFPPSDSIDINTPLRTQTQRAKRQLEREIILKVLQAHKWNRRKAAFSLDISYRALLYKIKEAGVLPIRQSRQCGITATSSKIEEEHGGS
jgi:two-component system response regulator AtoC